VQVLRILSSTLGALAGTVIVTASFARSFYDSYAVCA
jgi:hypothetical protein